MTNIDHLAITHVKQIREKNRILLLLAYERIILEFPMATRKYLLKGKIAIHMYSESE